MIFRWLQPVFCVLILFQTHYAQVQTETDESAPPPSEERFEKSDGLIVPWRDSLCPPEDENDAEGGKKACGVVPAGTKYWERSVVTIYNNDGSIWWTFGLRSTDKNYFWQTPKSNFEPFSTLKKKWPESVFLRLVGSSKNWYEVEINETIRETRYVLKSDKSWSKTSWEFWLNKNVNLHLSENHDPLRESPDGKVVEGLEHTRFRRVRLLSINGNWAYVEGVVNNEFAATHQGWVKWQDGRKIVVGCVFNAFKVPKN